MVKVALPREIEQEHGDAWEPPEDDLFSDVTTAVADPPARTGRRTYADLLALAESCPVFTLPVGPAPADPTPSTKHTEEQLDEFAERGQFPDNSRAAISNEDLAYVPSGDDSGPEPASLTSILDTLGKRFRGWPRMVSGSLFVPNGPRIEFLENVDSLFAWLAKFGLVTWHKGENRGFVTQRQFFHAWRQHARRYRAIENFPHEPRIHEHFYSCRRPEPGDGTALERFLDFFAPATPIDRDLIMAALATLVWGGPAGARPVFLITADEGRGKGKSKLAEKLASIVGGTIDVSAHDEIREIKARLLSPEGLTKRAVLLDNVKSHRFSWAEFEALVTATEISGKRLYVGEGSRPNTLTTFITLNGASLSTDMAQRCIVVKLAEPERSGGWEESLNSFIETNRQAIIADLVAFLRRPQEYLPSFTRWAAWEDAVLRRLPRPDEIQDLIIERQGAANIEAEESEIIEDYFADRLKAFGYDVRRDEHGNIEGVDKVHIPSKVASEWFSLALGKREEHQTASRRLSQMIDEKQLTRIVKNSSRTHGRGLLWIGPQWDGVSDALYTLETKVEIWKSSNPPAIKINPRHNDDG